MRTINHIWARDPAYNSIWLATTPLALAYAGILGARALWWRRFAHDAPLPTISIGNLTVGGNAKTPFALFLAARLQQQGLKIGLVSRGYGGRNTGRAGLVSDGNRLLMTVREAGDEPVMLARSFDGPVAVARRRIAALKLLADNNLADAAVLDDGFQHLRLKRDLDLLLINQAQGLGNRWVLPAGPLRESASAIARADAVVLLNPSGRTDCEDKLKAHISDKLVLPARLEPSALVRPDAGPECAENRTTLESLRGRRVMAVSGLANPAGFHSMLRELGANLVQIFDYPDHHDYRDRDWQNILSVAQRAEMLITTEKDLVKLETFPREQISVYALRLKVTMDKHDEARLISLALDRIKRARQALHARSKSGMGGHRCGIESGPS